ncbi:hypothetical protein B2J93_4027 [Marssonina coronariae]|uniref:Uncharacterized protein n=1 Tax=Diplocarpon coronariae TaxID=2795749 RepID=A0A218ZBT1_9HELO|nr:hypothetical protein B2J93_4027 [Marssonina coronariae]
MVEVGSGFPTNNRASPTDFNAMKLHAFDLVKRLLEDELAKRPVIAPIIFDDETDPNGTLERRFIHDPYMKDLNAFRTASPAGIDTWERRSKNAKAAQAKGELELSKT